MGLYRANRQSRLPKRRTKRRCCTIGCAHENLHEDYNLRANFREHIRPNRSVVGTSTIIIVDVPTTRLRRKSGYISSVPFVSIGFGNLTFPLRQQEVNFRSLGRSSIKLRDPQNWQTMFNGPQLCAATPDSTKLIASLRIAWL